MKAIDFLGLGLEITGLMRNARILVEPDRLRSPAKRFDLSLDCICTTTVSIIGHVV